jgi:Bacterial SH3 domain
VRYIVKPKDASKTILRIDAVFVEDFRRIPHPSDGSVESAEYKDIQDQIDAIELQKKQAQESEQRRQQEIAKRALERKKEDEELALAQNSAENLEQYVEKLRRKAERVIKASGAQLRSAPFQTASDLRNLDAGSEVVILIETPYWYGVETEDGQHGWIRREQLELLP